MIHIYNFSYIYSLIAYQVPGTVLVTYHKYQNNFVVSIILYVYLMFNVIDKA